MAVAAVCPPCDACGDQIQADIQTDHETDIQANKTDIQADMQADIRSFGDIHRRELACWIRDRWPASSNSR